MSTTTGRIAIFAGAVGVLLLAGGAVAFGAIPNLTTGVISGCYTNTSPHVLRVIDTAKTAKCPTGTTAINWNQKGPQGPQGPVGVVGEVVRQNSVSFPVGLAPPGLQSVGVYCDQGYVATGGGFALSGPMGIGGNLTEKWIPYADYAIFSGGVPTGWTVGLAETGSAGDIPGSNYVLNAYVNCAPTS